LGFVVCRWLSQLSQDPNDFMDGVVQVKQIILAELADPVAEQAIKFLPALINRAFSLFGPTNAFLFAGSRLIMERGIQDKETF
jgi:hypothetical protein